MNILTTAATGTIKGVMWLVHFLLNAQALGAKFAKLSPGVLAALSALFYDVMKALTTAESAAASTASGNVLAGITLSETTIGLLKKVAEDFKAGEQLVVADFKELGITQ